MSIKQIVPTPVKKGLNLLALWTFSGKTIINIFNGTILAYSFHYKNT